jgi:hypothetical protein
VVGASAETVDNWVDHEQTLEARASITHQFRQVWRFPRAGRLRGTHLGDGGGYRTEETAQHSSAQAVAE